MKFVYYMADFSFKIDTTLINLIVHLTILRME